MQCASGVQSCFGLLSTVGMAVLGTDKIGIGTDASKVVADCIPLAIRRCSLSLLKKNTVLMTEATAEMALWSFGETRR
jgi:hypothetical protein